MLTYVDFYDLIFASPAVFICIDAHFKQQQMWLRCVTVYDL